MIVIGAVLTLVLSFLVVIAVVVPKIKIIRKKRKTPPLSLPAPPSPQQKIKQDIDLIWIQSYQDWCEFYKNIGVKPPKRSFALQKYHPDNYKVKTGTEEEKLRASVIWNFIQSHEDPECKMPNKKNLKKIVNN